MKKSFRPLRALVLLLACLIPMSCLVESEGELRVFSIDLGKFTLDSGYLVVYLADTAGARQKDQKDLYKGLVPKEKTLRLEAPGYGGEEAILVLQEYLLLTSQGGDTLLTVENLLREYRLRVRQGDSARLLPSTPLPIPSRPQPADSARDVALDAKLGWLLGATPEPRPRSQIRWGTTNPPPAVASSVAQGDSSLFLGTLQPETEYFWQVISIRGQESRPGPVWRFRTRPLPPARLAYPSCEACHLNRPMSLTPTYAGGGEVRYSVEPPLPGGLTLDSLTGAIRGVPSAFPDSAGYTIRAANVSGTVAFQLHPDIRPRLITVDAGAMAAGTGRISATLWSPENVLIDSLWAGPKPASDTLRKEVAAYDGEEAFILVQAFRDTLIAGETRESFAEEKRFRVWQSKGIYEPVAAPALEAPLLLSPADSARDLDTLVDLAWEPGSALMPAPLAELRFGLTNPPEPLAAGLAGPRSLRVRALPDTDYYWQVVNVRAGLRSPGPVRRFRTRLLPPSSLGYPGADSVYHVGGADTLVPAYAGGGRVRYSAEPPLPKGFALDSLTGILVVSPQSEAAPGDYLLRAGNAAGSVAARLRFRVDSRLHRLDIPDSVKQGDSLSLVLADASGRVLASLWDGPPPAASTLSWSRGHDDGSEAQLVYRSFRGGALLVELRYRLLDGVIERLPPAVPGAPSLPLPVSGALDQDTALALAWSQDSLPGPPPFWRLRLGLAEPLPILFDSLREPRAALPPLLPDTLYRWSVTALRAGTAVSGPAWSFRTRPAPPRQLGYPEATVLRIGYPASVTPAYAGGTRARYRVEPALPAGLALDSLTGRVAGTPADTAPETVYTVTAANVSGSVRAELRLRVDWRLVQVALPEEARAGDSAVARLLDVQGRATDTLWDGPLPPDLRVGASTPRYDGSAAGLLALVFRRGALIREYRYRISGPFGAAEALALGSLPAPANVFPSDSAQAADTVLGFAWTSGVADPPPLARLYLGTSFPPPLYADSLRGDSLPSVPLKPDTRYYWRVEILRAARSALSPLASFRTRPAAPQALAYAINDSLVPLDRVFLFTPASRASGARFSIDPALPGGWGFDQTTGAVYGTATDLLPLQEYTVTLSNISGSLSTRFRLGVGFRELDFPLPDTVLRYDSVSVRLLYHFGYDLQSLYEGPPPDSLRVRARVEYYDGTEAAIVIQGYRRNGDLMWESFRDINTQMGKWEYADWDGILGWPFMGPPEQGEEVLSEAVRLGWWPPGSRVQPEVQYMRLYFGLTNPPPLYADSLQGIYEYTIPSTLPDTVYYWRMQFLRGPADTSSDVFSFRSYSSLGHDLSYPAAESVYVRGTPVRLEPDYRGRAGVRFSTRPLLPPGMDIDSVTGVISGVPNGPSPRMDYTVSTNHHVNSIQISLPLRIADDGDTAVRAVARWEMDDTTEYTLTDSSGHGFHGFHNSALSAAGLRGRALAFNGLNFAEIQARDALQVSGFTLSLWVQPQRLDSIQALLEYSRESDNLGLSCVMNTTAWATGFDDVVVPGAVDCNLRPSDATLYTGDEVWNRNNMGTAGGLIKTGRWNHVAFTFDPRTWQAVIYVNGQPAATRTLKADFTPRTKGRIFLGFRPPGTSGDKRFGLRGNMDHVEIFDGALGPAAIAEMYRSLAP